MSGSSEDLKTIIIDDEIEAFRVIMDIRDELAMISSVLMDQETVVTSLTTLAEFKGKQPKDQVSLDFAVQRWRAKFAGIDKRAEMVEKTVSF